MPILQHYPRPTETQQREFSNTIESHTLGLAFLLYSALPSPCFNSLGITSQNKISPCLMLCISGGTHAKQHLFQQCQHTSLLSHRSQSSLQYPLAQCTTHSPLILTSACIYFLWFVPNIQEEYPSFCQNHHSPCLKSTLSVFIPKWIPSNSQILQYQHSDYYQKQSASLSVAG